MNFTKILKSKKTAFCAVALSVFALASVFAGRMISFKDLPKEVRAEADRIFPGKAPYFVEADGNEYELYYTGGAEIEFYGNDWKKIESREGLSRELVPEKILRHIKAEFDNLPVKSIERDFRKLEIELINGLEIEYTDDGEFIKVDY